MATDVKVWHKTTWVKNKDTGNFSFDPTNPPEAGQILARYPPKAKKIPENCIGLRFITKEDIAVMKKNIVIDEETGDSFYLMPHGFKDEE